jgi:hypothetical protein
MEIPRIHCQIHDLAEDLKYVTGSRNWHRQRYSKFIDYFREHEIPLPFHPEASPDPKPQYQTSNIPLTKLEEIKHALLLDLNLSCDRDPCRHRYSPQTMSFCLTAHVFSGARYGFLREILDPLSEQTLREFSSLPVTLFQTHLAVVQVVKPRITAYLQNYPSLLTAPVRCTLCIDAFQSIPRLG